MDLNAPALLTAAMAIQRWCTIFQAGFLKNLDCLNLIQIILKDQGCNARYLRNEDVSEFNQNWSSLYNPYFASFYTYN